MLDLSYDTPKPRVIAGAKHDWELVIGMEVHAQVASNAKLFSGASTKFGAEPNSNVAFVDAAMPGNPKVHPSEIRFIRYLVKGSCCRCCSIPTQSAND